MGSIAPLDGPLEVTRHRPWASVGQVRLRDGALAWFKACRPVQGFEPRLTAELHRRWPGRVAEVLGHDEARGWLLTADAGPAIEWGDDALPKWLDVLPRYAELQMGERANVADHLEHGVPDVRLEVLPARYDELAAAELPIEAEAIDAIRVYAPRFAEACAELAIAAPGPSVQHDDLHGRSVHDDGSRIRVMDWGDASIGQPLFSLVRLDLSLGETLGQAARDRWFPRLRDAYLEPWGRDARPAFDLAQRVGLIAHTFTWTRHRSAMPASNRPAFDAFFGPLLRRVLAAIASGG